MAGHDDGDGISSVRGAYGSGCVRVAELSCELAVASGFAEGNGEESFPYILLEAGASHVEGDGERLAFAGEVFGELTLRLKEDRMLVVCDQFAETHAVGVVVFPEDGYEAFIACD